MRTLLLAVCGIVLLLASFSNGTATFPCTIGQINYPSDMTTDFGVTVTYNVPFTGTPVMNCDSQNSLCTDSNAAPLMNGNQVTYYCNCGGSYPPTSSEVELTYTQQANGQAASCHEFYPNPPLNVKITEQPLCPGDTSTSVTFTITGGTGTGYKMTFSGISGLTSFTGATTTQSIPVGGPYSVTIVDSTNTPPPSGPTSFSVTAPPAITVTPSHTLPTCYGGSNGQISLVASGGSNTGFTYTWVGPYTGSTITGLEAGTYLVTVLDSNQCSSGQQTIVLGQPDLISVTVLPSEPSCFGSTNGFLATEFLGISTVSGGTPYAVAPQYLYSWTYTLLSGGGQQTSNNPNVNGLGAVASYSLVVSDSNNCQSQAATGSLGQPTQFTAIGYPQKQPICYTDTDGTASITVTGGITPYTYTWSNLGASATATGDTASGLTSGDKPSVSVVDANGCGPTGYNFFVTSQSSQISFNPPSTTQVDCFGQSTGAITASAQGGSGSLSYSWNVAGSTPGAAITGLAAGLNAYTVTATDTLMCSNTATYSITQPTSALSVSVSQTPPQQIQCNGQTGSATAAATGGSPGMIQQYSYQWFDLSQMSPAGSSATTTVSANNLYSVTATDYLGCTASATITPTQPDPIMVTPTQNAPSCPKAGDGSISVTVDGGVKDNQGDYSYKWFAGQSPIPNDSPGLTGLSPGSYSLSIYDANNCPALGNPYPFQINDPQQLVISSGGQTATKCFGDSTGTATVTASGGTGVLSYSWDNGASSVLTQTGAVASDLSGGTTYTVTVTDANNCPASPSTIQYAITSAPQITMTETLASHVDVKCKGQATGALAVTETNADVAGFTIMWTDAQGKTWGTGIGLSVNNLPAGTYTGNLLDLNSCTASLAITINEPVAALTAGIKPTEVVCRGTSDGSAVAIGAGGTTASGTYTYSWNDTANTPKAGVSNLFANIPYQVTVTDDNSCTATHTVTLTQPPALAISTNHTLVSCFSGDSYLASFVSGGTTPYSYSWWPAGGNLSGTTPVPSGIYIITATDACNNDVVQSVIVPQPTLLTVVPSQMNVMCNGDNSGTATAYVTGGTPDYTYQWTPSGGNTELATGLAAGDYNFTVTDYNGCSEVQRYTITQPTAINITTTSTPVKCYGASTGSFSITAKGGAGRYEYSWSPSNIFGTSANNVPAGMYEVVVSDANFCSESAIVTVAQPAGPIVITPTQTNIMCNGGKGSASATVSGGTGTYTYSWSNGAKTATASNLVAGTYVLTVTDSNGCQMNQTYTVSQPATLMVSPSQQNVNCYGSSVGSATASVVGGTSAYSYIWTGINGTNFTSVVTGTSANSSSIKNLVAGQYSLLVRDANMCTAAVNYTISEPDTPLNITFDIDDITCKGAPSGNVTVVVVGGAPGYTIVWNDNSTNSVRRNLTAGLYGVTVSDAAGCSQQFSFAVTEPAIQFCKNNATCLGLGKCLCQGFWNGTDCSIPVCPSGCANGTTCVGPNTCSNSTTACVGALCGSLITSSASSLYMDSRFGLVFNSLLLVAMFVAYMKK